MAYEENSKRQKTYSYVGFLNGRLSFDSESMKSTKNYSYVGFLNGKLPLKSEQIESTELVESPASLFDSLSQNEKSEKEIYKTKKFIRK